MQFASLHSWKEGCGFERLHSGTRFQKFAVSGVPAHHCHVKGQLTATQVFHLIRKLVLSKRALSVVWNWVSGVIDDVTADEFLRL